MKTKTTINVEFHGRFQSFDRLFNDGKILLNLAELNAEPIPNKHGGVYTIVDTNVEQGRNFIVAVTLGVDKKCCLDNFAHIFKVSEGCNMSVVDTKVSSVDVC